MCFVRFFLCGLELHERSDWRATAPNTHRGHSLIKHCVHILQACTDITIWCTTVHDNKSHIAYDCITHQIMVLLPIMHHFIGTKSYVTTYKVLSSIVSTYTLQCLSNYSECINTHTLTLKLIRSTTVLLDQLTKYTLGTSLVDMAACEYMC